jgi:hypothetical protein
MGNEQQACNRAVVCDDPTLMAQAASRRALSHNDLASPAWQRLRKKVGDRERRAGRPDPVCEACCECIGTDFHSDRVYGARERASAHAVSVCRWAWPSPWPCMAVAQPAHDYDEELRADDEMREGSEEEDSDPTASR